jgi:hypothetical protein
MDWADLFNFHDSLYVVKFHWVWMLVALGSGVWVGWYTGEAGRAGTGKTERGE